MKVAIVHYVAGISAKILVTALRNNNVEAEAFRLNKTDRVDFTDFDYVFSYGCSGLTVHKNRINSSKAVKTCVSKAQSFEAFKRAQVDTVEYTLKKPIPDHWDWVVVRDDENGRKAEGLSYHENGPAVPEGKLFTEYYDHKYEYRIMVFRGEIVGRYFKHEDAGDWYFNLQPAKGFEEMDAQCLRATAALGIDYVGFDVIANTKKKFKIIEANSGPRITDEAENAIVEYFINL